MENGKFKVVKNVDAIHTEKMRRLVEDGDPEDIARFLLETFENATVPPVKPEGLQTIIAEMPKADTPENIEPKD